MPRTRSRASLARLAILAVLALVALTAAACGSSGDGEATAAASTSASTAASTDAKPFTLRYGVVSVNGDPEGPNGLALKNDAVLKHLAPAGVTDIKVTTFPNGPNLAAALAAGDLDIGELGDTPALVAGSQGVEAKLLQIYQQNNQAWLIGRKGGPTTLPELAGKKVATAPGSYMDRFLKGLIHEEGLDGKVQVGALLPPAGVSAIQNGSLDAYAFPFPIGASLAEKGFPVIAKATDHEGLAGNSVTLITDSALADHPKLAEAWRASTQAGNQAVRDDPDAFWTFESTSNKVSPAAAQESYPVENYPLEPFPADAVSALQGTLDYLVESKQAKDFDLSAWQVPTG
jgi:NitT/TauT family transport system substrate-binding protein/sulfonate transport system substrate-binding protein